MASSNGAAAPESGDEASRTAHLRDPPPLALPPVRPAAGVDEASAVQPVTASSFTYTPYYCEENVYLLCKQLSLFGAADSDGGDLFVVFISNDEKQVPLWHQKASKRVDGLVIWDYHVICIQFGRNGEGDILHVVWDLDSSLPFPFPLNEYVAETLQPLLSSYFMSKRYFRVVHAPMFLCCFASDRTHMKDPTGNWISAPPMYNPIVAEDGTTNNIDEYIEIHAADKMADMTHLVDSLFGSKLGVVVSEEQLVELFSWIHMS